MLSKKIETLTFYQRKFVTSLAKNGIRHTLLLSWITLLNMKRGKIPSHSVRLSQGPYCGITLDISSPTSLHSSRSIASTNFSVLEKRCQISAAAMVLNEMKSIKHFFLNILNQSISVNEIVMLDAGSVDGTLEWLETEGTRLAKEANVHLRIIRKDKASYAKGRNVLFAACKSDFIVAFDCGCIYNENYVESLFVLASSKDFNRERAVVATTYDAQTENGKKVPNRVESWSEVSDLNWKSFLPSMRSFGIWKSAITENNLAFSEWITSTGEDTLFMLELRRKKFQFFIIKDSLVTWIVPSAKDEWNRKMLAYAKGDGETGAKDHKFSKLRIANKNLKQVKAYNEGFLSRPEIDITKRNIRRAWVICSLTPYGDSGGAQRTSQIARFISNKLNERVIFLSAERSYESSLHEFTEDPTLVTLGYPEEEIVEKSILKYAELGCEMQIIIEAPHSLFLRLVESIKVKCECDQKITIHYSVIDEWDGSLGGSWYLRSVEDEIVQIADTLSATARPLVSQYNERYKGKNFHYVPNAANSDIFFQKKFNKDKNSPSKILYAGALWGSWFDWESVFEAADLNPDWEFYLVGDLDLWRQNLINTRYRNIFFSGLVPQTQLNDMYNEADVLLIPFKLSTLVNAVNPLKLHEYILCNKPVASSELSELSSLGNCQHLYSYDRNLNSLSDAIRRALAWDGNCLEIDKQVNRHTGIWTWGDVATNYIDLRGVASNKSSAIKEEL